MLLTQYSHVRILDHDKKVLFVGGYHNFMFFSGIVFGRPLYELWGPKVPKRRFLGIHFSAISRSVAKMRMKLPCRRQHRLRGFRPPQKRQISTLFSEEVRGSSGIAVFRAFDVFGCPLDFKNESFFCRFVSFFCRFYMKDAC